MGLTGVLGSERNVRIKWRCIPNARPRGTKDVREAVPGEEALFAEIEVERQRPSRPMKPDVHGVVVGQDEDGTGHRRIVCRTPEETARDAVQRTGIPEKREGKLSSERPQETRHQPGPQAHPQGGAQGPQRDSGLCGRERRNATPEGSGGHCDARRGAGGRARIRAPNACVSDTHSRTATGYSQNDHGHERVDRWMRVLAAFGDYSGYTAMTAAEAQTMVDT